MLQQPVINLDIMFWKYKKMLIYGLSAVFFIQRCWMGVWKDGDRALSLPE